MQLLETILVEDGKIYLLDKHLDRIKRACNAFKFIEPDWKLLEKEMNDLITFTNQPFIMRLLISENGQYQIEHKPFQPLSDPYFVCLDSQPTLFNQVSEYKTTNRSIYQEALKRNSSVNDVILWNERNEIMESCIANICIETPQGHFLTPAASSGLIKGTYRQEWLEKENSSLIEKVITKSEFLEIMNQGSTLYLMNAVRKLFKVKFIS